MNFEKVSYSFIWSLIAGAIIQDTMNWPWPYFLIISVCLWAICIGMQYYSFKKEVRIRDKCADQELAKHNEEFERIISTIENCTNQQIASLKEGLDLIKEHNGEENRRVIGEVRKLLLSLEKYDDMNAKKSQEIIDLLTRFEKEYSEISNEQSSQIELMFKDSFLSLQVSLDSINDNLSYIRKIENGIDVNICNMTKVLSDCMDKSVKDLKEDVNKNVLQHLEELKGSISNLQSEVEFVNVHVSNIDNTEEQQRGMQEDANNKLNEIYEEIQNIVNQFSERLTEGIDKQSDIILREEEILVKYDVVLKRINDEVIIKLINDSNNMLKCIKDCYNLLEMIRRNRK